MFVFCYWVSFRCWFERVLFFSFWKFGGSLRVVGKIYFRKKEVI